MKFNWKIGKDKWLILLAVGLLLLVLTIPSGPETEKKMLKDAASGTEASLQEGLVTEAGEPVAVAANADRTYEQQLEQRVKQILKTVDGVGTVDVMIVLKSSEEKVLRVDKNTSTPALRNRTAAAERGRAAARNSRKVQF